MSKLKQTDIVIADHKCGFKIVYGVSEKCNNWILNKLLRNTHPLIMPAICINEDLLDDFLKEMEEQGFVNDPQQYDSYIEIQDTP